MNQYDFYTLYGNERTAMYFFKDYIQYKLTACSKCGCKTIPFYEKLKGWRCKSCRKIISIKSITFMRDSNLKFIDWLEIIFLITQGKKTDSTLNLLRKSRQTRYDTLAFAIKKLRLEMGKINVSKTSKFNQNINFGEHEIQSKIDYTGIPSSMNLFLKKLETKNYDKIRLTLSQHDRTQLKEIYKTKIHSPNNRQKKLHYLIDGPEASSNQALKKIKTSWLLKIKENFTKEVRGIYHNISLPYIQGVMDEYCFKYNCRHSLTDRFKVFMIEYIFIQDRITGSQ